MIFEVFTIIISLIAIILSFISFSQTRRDYDYKEFKELNVKIINGFQEFYDYITFEKLVSYKYDYENIVLNCLKKKEVLGKDYNELQKQLGINRINIDKTYSILIRLLGILDNDMVIKQINSLNELINDIYASYIDYNNLLLDLNENSVYIYQKDSKKKIINIIEQLYNSIFLILDRTVIFEEYIRSFEVVSFKLLSNRKEFYLNKKSENFYLLDTVGRLSSGDVGNIDYKKQYNESINAKLIAYKKELDYEKDLLKAMIIYFDHVPNDYVFE